MSEEKKIESRFFDAAILLLACWGHFSIVNQYVPHRGKYVRKHMHLDHQMVIKVNVPISSLPLFLAIINDRNVSSHSH